MRTVINLAFGLTFILALTYSKDLSGAFEGRKRIGSFILGKVRLEYIRLCEARLGKVISCEVVCFTMTRLS
jgi:hypothetical protein